MQKKIGSLFLVSALILLIIGAVAGVLISVNYILPDFMKELIPFNQLRPIHTTSVVSWIVLAATGGVYYYINQEVKLYSPRIAFAHYLLFAFTFFGILISLISGQMGGREYLVFHPAFMIPILAGWILFGWNYFRSLIGKVRDWPVYYWMWGTGIVFMVFHLSESNFWVFDYFRKDFIRDMTVQWKSYGSFVGSWNMLVYGTAIYLMAKIKNDQNPGRGKLLFFFYFLGLTNLMFGWAHHTYPLPTLPWVRYVAYGISMTEWIIFIRMIYVWSRSLEKSTKKDRSLSYRFLIASDIWVFLNLLMALLMSIPYLNNFSHGTHITVAHSMGTTIGINTMILLASVSYIIETNRRSIRKKAITRLFYTINIALGGFWISLIAMGVKKIIWIRSTDVQLTQALHEESHAFYVLFILFGVILCGALIALSLYMIRALLPDLYYLILPKSLQKEWDHVYGEN